MISDLGLCIGLCVKGVACIFCVYMLVVVCWFVLCVYVIIIVFVCVSVLCAFSYVLFFCACFVL